MQVISNGVIPFFVSLPKHMPDSFLLLVQNIGTGLSNRYSTLELDGLNGGYFIIDHGYIFYHV